jgi:hypothetical protein
VFAGLKRAECHCTRGLRGIDSAWQRQHLMETAPCH